MAKSRLTRRQFVATTAAASATAIAAPFVHTANAAGKLAIMFWDHWVPGANKATTDLVNEWAAKEKVEVAIDYITSQGNKLLLTTAAEAQAALRVFLRDRLPYFGPHEDAMLSGDRFMAHSLLSAPMNLGLLDPLECAYAAEDAYRSRRAPLGSVEGYIRQLIGWRDYIWHVYWHFGPNYRRRNALGAHARLPKWFADLDAARSAGRGLELWRGTWPALEVQDRCCGV